MKPSILPSPETIARFDKGIQKHPPVHQDGLAIGQTIRFTWGRFKTTRSGRIIQIAINRQSVIAAYGKRNIRHLVPVSTIIKP